MPLWILWLQRSLFQVATAVFFATLLLLVFLEADPIPYPLEIVAAVGAAILGTVWMLATPANPWARVAGVLAPAAASALRALELLWLDPIQWPGAVVWGFLAFTFVWVGPRLLPPPLRNGERIRWLRETGIG